MSSLVLNPVQRAISKKFLTCSDNSLKIDKVFPCVASHSNNTRKCIAEAWRVMGFNYSKGSQRIFVFGWPQPFEQRMSMQT